MGLTMIAVEERSAPTALPALSSTAWSFPSLRPATAQDSPCSTEALMILFYNVYLRIILLKCSNFAVSNRSIKADCETSPVDVLNDKLSCESGGSIHHQVVATHPCHRLH